MKPQSADPKHVHIKQSTALIICDMPYVIYLITTPVQAAKRRYASQYRHRDSNIKRRFMAIGKYLRNKSMKGCYTTNDKQ